MSERDGKPGEDEPRKDEASGADAADPRAATVKPAGEGGDAEGVGAVAAAAASAASESASAVDDELEPLPPAPVGAKAGAADVRKAVAKVKPPAPPPGRRRGVAYAVLAGVLIVGAAVTVVMSWLNSRDYYLVCGNEAVLAQRGRRWLWGRTPLEGARWRPIQIAVDARCTDEKLATEEELAESFVRTLLAQANTRLQKATPEDVDEAERQLEQALLLTRAHPDRRGPIERLQGDVEYWRAAAEVQAAVGKLGAAATRFERAAAQRPTLKTDAPAWAAFARYLADEIRKGPPGLRPVTAPPVGPDTRPPFIGTGETPEGQEVGGPGVAVPVGPGGAPKPPGAVGGPGAADAGPPRVDAAPPTGGILL